VQEVRKIATSWFTVAFIFALSLVCVAQNGKVDTLGPLTDNAVPEGVRQALDSKGHRMTLDGEASTCELWVRKSVPAQTKKDVDGVAYPQLAESVLVGVMHFPQSPADIRRQKVPAGFYTLRYALMPNDGNHLGAAPNRDFLLLVPAASDANPNATFKFPELMALSESATGTKHPSPLSLVPADSGVTAPSVSRDDQDHWIFSASMKLTSGEDLPFALVVKGTAQQ
jgi:hypothetical protein